MSNQEQLYQLEQIAENRFGQLQIARNELRNHAGVYRRGKKYKRFISAKKGFQLAIAEYDRLRPIPID